jgi:hypothetical protein
VRTRQKIPAVKQRKESKYNHLVGTTIGTRLILESLPRSLFEVVCIECNHHSVQRGIDLKLLETRECLNCKINNRDPNLNTIYLRIKGSASVRGLEFELTKDYVADIASQPCAYCNDKTPSQEGTRVFVSRCRSYHGLDRIDPNVGYVKGNVVACCKYCNYAKHDLSLSEFKKWLTKCYKHTILNSKESS